MDGNAEGLQGEEVLILLLGGTSETAEIADALAARGFLVLVSTATDNELDVGMSRKIKKRAGRMDESEMSALIKEKEISAVVDATHPFAEIVSETAKTSAKESGVPYFRFARSAQDYDYEKIIWVKNHKEAANAAFKAGKPPLLTTGSRNLAPYMEQSRKTGIKIVARVLPHGESRKSCRDAGLSEASVIFARGPFTVKENLELIKKFGIGTVVTKDSGKAGGVIEKVEAAKTAGCIVVLIERPDDGGSNSFESVEELVDSLTASLSEKTRA
ncbi:MAG: precorrin-6A reductase [Nitrospinota bacterium]